MKLILTCEHACREIPAKYRYLFEGAELVLNSHRGYDPGALDIFRNLQGLTYYSKTYNWTRLLVEPNRSLHHPQLFSEFTQNLSEEEKNKLLKKYYYPYRISVEKKIAETILAGQEVIHLSVHTFTPVLKGQERKADVGLLFDPKNAGEKEFCKTYKKALLAHDPQLRVRYNYPYRGTADGFTTFLRKRFPQHYLGIEIEVNQKFSCENSFPPSLKNVLFRALSEVLPRQNL